MLWNGKGLACKNYSSSNIARDSARVKRAGYEAQLVHTYDCRAQQLEAIQTLCANSCENTLQMAWLISLYLACHALCNDAAICLIRILRLVQGRRGKG